MDTTASTNAGGVDSDKHPPVAVDPSPIPAVLRARPQWVCWKYIESRGRQTKCPVNAHTGQLADSTDRTTWVSFDEAAATCQGSGQYAGVGYVFSADDPFCGIDLDECIVDDTLVPEAQTIVDALDSYTEISPSGLGVKILIEAVKPAWARCRSKQIDGFKEIEIYDQKRFFALTGRRLPGTPAQIRRRLEQLEALCRRLWPACDAPRRPACPVPAIVITDDEALLERVFASKHGDAVRRLWDGETTAYNSDDSAADLALCNHLAFWTGRDKERMDRLFRRSGLYRDKWERTDYRDRTLDRAIADCRDVYSGPGNGKGGGCSPGNGAARQPAAPNDDRPTIHIDVDEHRVIAETIASLRADPGLYQRGNMLVRVLREKHAHDGVVRPEGSATIVQVPAANLRERMTRHARFTRNRPHVGIVASHPTAWLVAGVDARGEWPGIRHLTGVSDAPILRPDGSVWQTRGHDPKTGVLFDPPEGVAFPPIRSTISADEVRAAREQLLEVVCDFRFEAAEHRAAWLAGLLTPLARFAFVGPAPLFLFDANVRAAGKGLLAQTIGQIVLGREMPVSSYARDSDEMRKKITALAIAGDRMVLLDNLEGKFGNDALDRALTSTRWKDRILGKSEQIDLPLLPVWYGTGNNVQVAADTTRRIIHIRLDVLEEHPEDRTDFRHPDLIAWVRQERGRLLAAALTTLSASLRSGRPRQDLTPYGSFEGWSHLVREAVAWLGLPDPCLTRARLAESSDTTADALTQLVDAWRDVDPDELGIVIAELLAKLYPTDLQHQPRDEASIAMRAALENVVGCRPGKAPATRQVGNRLKHFRRRVVGGEYLDFNPGEYHRKGAVWRLRHVDAAE